MTERAVILAGGKGTRLKPYTVCIPKPLVPLDDLPILEVVIRRLASQGFGHITLAVNHLADLIRAFFGDGSKWGIHIDYSLEPEPLSTMAPLRLIPDLPEHFLVMNGDVLTDMDFRAFLEDHRRRGDLFTVATQEREVLIDYGVLESGPDGLLTAFREKPRLRYRVSTGIYAASREVLDLIPPGRRFGFDDLMLELLRRGRPARSVPFDGVWFDIGRPEDYEKATEFFLRHRNLFLPEP